jgi:hypothetical protein
LDIVAAGLGLLVGGGAAGGEVETGSFLDSQVKTLHHQNGCVVAPITATAPPTMIALTTALNPVSAIAAPLEPGCFFITRRRVLRKRRASGSRRPTFFVEYHHNILRGLDDIHDLGARREPECADATVG